MFCCAAYCCSQQDRHLLGRSGCIFQGWHRNGRLLALHGTRFEHGLQMTHANKGDKLKRIMPGGRQPQWPADMQWAAPGRIERRSPAGTAPAASANNGRRERIALRALKQKETGSFPAPSRRAVQAHARSAARSVCTHHTTRRRRDGKFRGTCRRHGGSRARLLGLLVLGRVVEARGTGIIVVALVQHPFARRVQVGVRHHCSQRARVRTRPAASPIPRFRAAVPADSPFRPQLRRRPCRPGTR